MPVAIGIIIFSLIVVPMMMKDHSKRKGRPGGERSWVTVVENKDCTDQYHTGCQEPGNSCRAHHSGISDFEAFERGEIVDFKMWHYRQGYECESGIKIRK